MASESSHTLRTLTIDGTYLPPLGHLIKLPLGRCLEGSLTSATSPNMSIQSTSSTPLHSALVVGCGYSRLVDHQYLDVKCFAVLYFHREENPAERILQHPLTHMFLPLPSSVHVKTPPEFGEPIQVGGYVSDRPCWLHLRMLTVQIAVGKKVRFSALPESLAYCSLLMSR